MNECPPMVCSMRPQTPRLRINSESIDGGPPSNQTQTTTSSSISSTASLFDTSPITNFNSNSNSIIRIEPTGDISVV